MRVLVINGYIMQGRKDGISITILGNHQTFLVTMDVYVAIMKDSPPLREVGWIDRSVVSELFNERIGK